jgi:predicted amidophosphoribosyltransferase
MKYGIKQQNNFIFCANCGRVISENGSYDAKYCFVCGNPLKIEAVEETENRIKLTEEALIKKLQNASKTLNTDSLKKALEQISE